MDTTRKQDNSTITALAAPTSSAADVAIASKRGGRQASVAAAASYSRALNKIFCKIKRDTDRISLDELEDIDWCIRSFNVFLSVAKANKQKQQSIKRQKVSHTVAASVAAGNDCGTTSTATATTTTTSTAATVISASTTTVGPPLLEQVLQLVCNSGFLKSPELGRSLLLTHPSITPELTPEFVFRALYNARRLDRWASPSSSSSSSSSSNPLLSDGTNDWIPDITLKARGHQIILNALESAPMTKTQIVALPHVSPLPILSSTNTIFIVSLWVLSQKIYSHQLSTNELERLTRTGHCYIPIRKAVVDIAKMSFQQDTAFVKELRRIRQKNQYGTKQKSTTATNNDGESSDNDGTKDSNNHKTPRIPTSQSDEPFVTAKIHAIRLDTHQLCTLYDSNIPRYEMRRAHATNDGVDFPLQRALKMRTAHNADTNTTHTTTSNENDEKSRKTDEPVATTTAAATTTSNSRSSNAGKYTDDDDGDDLLARWYKGYPDGIRNVGGLTFQVSLTDRRPSASTNSATARPSASSSSSTCTMHIQAKVLGASADQCESLRPRNGVNPFHILQGLAGWK